MDMDWFGDLNIKDIPWAELIRINPAPFVDALLASLITNASAANKVHATAARAALSLAIYNVAAQKDPVLAERLKAPTLNALTQATRAIESGRAA